MNKHKPFLLAHLFIGVPLLILFSVSVGLIGSGGMTVEHDFAGNS